MADSLPGWSISTYGGFPFQREYFACGRYIAFRREHFACGRYISFQREYFACGSCEEGKHPYYIISPIIMTHLIIFTNTLLPKTQGTGPLRGPLSRPPSSIGSAWRPRYCRIHRPTKNVTHTTTYAPKKRAQKGGARGGNTRASQLRALSPSQISAGKQFPDFPRCITAIRLHSRIKA